jgi:AcrR family transcriptional regulator
MARAPVGRQQLLIAARDELISGEGALELGALTRRAGLSTGALYHHFGSKSGLVAAVYDDFYAGLQAATADEHLPDSDWATRERERTGRFVAYHFDNPLAAVLLARIPSDTQLAELEAVYIQTMSARAAENIRHGKDLGQLPAGVDPDSAGAYVIGGLRNGIAQQLRRTPRRAPGRVADMLWQLTAATLGVEGHPHGA